LEKAWAEDKNYINVRDLLYSAYYNQGLSRQAAGELLDAKRAFEMAATLRPDLSTPRRLLAEVEFDLAPRAPVEPLFSPSIENKLILVGIAEQHMLVFDGDEMVFDFIISTGEPGRDTAVGEFEILDNMSHKDHKTARKWLERFLGFTFEEPDDRGFCHFHQTREEWNYGTDSKRRDGDRSRHATHSRSGERLCGV
jgi:hypothetical protein